jgi:predicted enzyme related to lactoylglutathione lyase
MTHRHHQIDYIELPVDEVATAKAFYGGAFGWSFTDYGPDYAGIRHPTEAGEEIGGLNARPVATRGDGPFVLLFSSDLDASVAAVTAAGGTVTEGPYEFPGGRRFHFTDPAGNTLGVWADA